MNLCNLHPALIPLANDFLAALAAEDLNILITCTFRSPEEQAEKYAQGRTMQGPIVTNAKPGQSDHNFMLNGRPASKAFDIVPLDKGHAVWDEKNPLWQTIATVWSRGFTNGVYCLGWYGAPGSLFHEYAHFYLKVIQK